MKEKQSKKLIQRGQRSPELGGGLQQGHKKTPKINGAGSTDDIAVTSLP